MKFRAAAALSAGVIGLAVLAAHGGAPAGNGDAPARSGDAPSPSGSDLLVGPAAFGDALSDAPGMRRWIRVQDMPAPFATPSTDDGPHMTSNPDGMPKAPKGFVIDRLMTHLSNPRKIITAPDGRLVLAESGANRIRVLEQKPDGAIASSTIFASGLHQPFGLAFYPGKNGPQLYVGDTDAVLRFDWAKKGDPEHIADLSGGGRLRGGGHWTRDVVFSLDDKKMFVSVGSHSNDDGDSPAEKNRADVLEFNPDGSGMRVYASGIRNAVGLAIEPTTGILWGSVNERDTLGDNLPPDYITHIQDGGFYGWPYFYIGNHPDPHNGRLHPELGANTIVPDVLLQAHSASLCMTFYEGSQFPAQYHGWAFAAEHGSWNRARRTGYKIIAVPIVNGKATGEYDDFVTGFVNADGTVWGRPVGVTVDRFGSLLFTDDGSGTLWRVRYVGG